MSDKPEPTAEEKMADALPANAKYVAAHQNSRMGLPVKPHIRFHRIRRWGEGLRECWQRGNRYVAYRDHGWAVSSACR